MHVLTNRPPQHNLGAMILHALQGVCGVLPGTRGDSLLDVPEVAHAALVQMTFWRLRYIWARRSTNIYTLHQYDHDDVLCAPDSLSVGKLVCQTSMKLQCIVAGKEWRR